MSLNFCLSKICKLFIKRYLNYSILVLVSISSFSQESHDTIMIRASEDTAFIGDSVSNNHSDSLNITSIALNVKQDTEKETNVVETNCGNRFIMLGKVLIVSASVILVAGCIGGWLIPEFIFLTHTPYFEIELITLGTGFLVKEAGLIIKKRSVKDKTIKRDLK